jgi:hypothetical protein
MLHLLNGRSTGPRTKAGRAQIAAARGRRWNNSAGVKPITRARTRAYLSQNSGWGERFMATGQRVSQGPTRPDAKNQRQRSYTACGGMPSPLSFGGQVWPGSLELLITILLANRCPVRLNGLFQSTPSDPVAHRTNGHQHSWQPRERLSGLEIRPWGTLQMKVFLFQ